MCEALAAVWCSAWAASLAPRYSPGCQPAARSIFWPKVLVLRAQLLLFGSVWMSCLLNICQYPVATRGSVWKTDLLGAARPILNPRLGYHTNMKIQRVQSRDKRKILAGSDILPPRPPNLDGPHPT